MSHLQVDEVGFTEASASGPLRHLCPHREEEDLGEVTIRWRCKGSTLELHALAEYLRSWERVKVSHETITDRIAHDLDELRGVEIIAVTTTWNTAGLEVTCSTSPIPVGKP